MVRHKNKSFSQGRAARLLFFILVVVNGALVLVVVPIAHAWFSHLYRIELFPAGYDLLASNLLDGRGLRYSNDTALTMMRTPAYPLMLAGLFALFGKSLAAAKLLNVVLTALAAGLLTRVTGRLTANHLAPMAAAALLLLSPPVLLAESRAGVEIPLMFCIVLFIERLQHAWNEDRTRDWIVAGIVLGLAALVRSTPLLFAVILLPIMWVAMRRNTSLRRIISRWGLLVVGFALVLSPWLARNYSLVGEWVPLMTRSGLSAHTGLYRCKHLSLEKGANSLIHGAAGERRAIAE